MIENKKLQEPENEQYPIEPRYHPIHKIPRKIYDLLASAKLAMSLLVIILICCITGVTFYRGVEAGKMIFGTIWFNGILILLVTNVGCCFFGRIWGRRITIVSLGMILFHMSFVTVFLGIVYNSLFFFRSTIRLTEEEVLRSDDPKSYDNIEKGNFFDFSRIKGNITLVKMHTGYRVDGKDKRAAYEVAVDDGLNRKQQIIYITHKLSHRGVDYFNDREGYSLLLVLSDKHRRELYGAHLPLQSIAQKDNTYLYATGVKRGSDVEVSPVLYPQLPDQPIFALQAEYQPSKLRERGGDVMFQLSTLDGKGVPSKDKPVISKKLAIGEQFDVGDYLLSAREVRYWVVMQVRYEPGKPFILASLWVGLAGMIITTVGRMMRKRRSPVK